MSVPNQNIIYGSVKSKEGYFLMCNQNALFAAMKDLKFVGLKMWLYLSKNQEDHSFELSLEACKKVGIVKNTYYEGIKELIAKGYLIQETGNGYRFYDTPQSSNIFLTPHSEFRNPELSENQTSENQNEPSEIRKNSSETQERNKINKIEYNNLEEKKEDDTYKKQQIPMVANPVLNYEWE